MTTISSAYDAVSGQLATTFPNHVELIDPYNPDRNDELTFDAAYGFALNDGLNTERQMSCEYTVRRLLTVTLTRKIFKGEVARNSYSVAERHSTEKQLFEDLHTLIKSVETNVTLNQGSGDRPIAWCKYQSDGGLEFVRGGQHNLIMVRAIFELEYFESLDT
jgi:hypothetical protein